MDFLDGRQPDLGMVAEVMVKPRRARALGADAKKIRKLPLLALAHHFIGSVYSRLFLINHLLDYLQGEVLSVSLRQISRVRRNPLPAAA